MLFVFCEAVTPHHLSTLIVFSWIGVWHPNDLADLPPGEVETSSQMPRPLESKAPVWLPFYPGKSA